MAKKDAAKRAAKKHAKEKKRQRKLAARPASVGTKDPVDAWKPAAEGIEGLAHRMRVGSQDAARLAELVAKNGRRPDARAAWLPSRVRALTTEQIVSELAGRGVVADEARFRALVATHESARRLAAGAWAPSMRPDATVHDRDFVGEAAVALWERWAPDVVMDEALHDQMRTAALQFEDGEVEVAAATWCAVWEQARGAGGLGRLHRSGGLGEDYASTLVDLLEELDTWDEPEDKPSEEAYTRGLTTLLEVRAQLPPTDALQVQAAIAEARLLRGLGRHVEAAEGLLGMAPAWPGEPDLLGEAAMCFCLSPDAPVELGERIGAALEAGRDATAGPERQAYERDLEVLRTYLQSRENAGR